MSDEIDIPEPLQRLVRFEDGAWVTRGIFNRHSLTMLPLGLSGISFVLGALALNADMAPSVFLSLGIVCLFLVLLAIIAGSRVYDVAFGRSGTVHRAHWAPRYGLVPVHLRGPPGRTVFLVLDGEALVGMPPDERWTYDHISWFGSVVAQHQGVALVDERDEAAWRLWETDPLERDRVSYVNKRDANHASYSHLLRAPTPPAGVDLHGLACRIGDVTLSLNAQNLIVDGKQLALREIWKIDVFFGTLFAPLKGFGVPVAGLRVLLTDGEQVRLPTAELRRAPQASGELAWIAEHVHAAAKASRANEVEVDTEAARRLSDLMRRRGGASKPVDR